MNTRHNLGCMFLSRRRDSGFGDKNIQLLTKHFDKRHQDVTTRVCLIIVLSFDHVVSGGRLSRCQPVSRRWKVNCGKQNCCMTSSLHPPICMISFFFLSLQTPARNRHIFLSLQPPGRKKHILSVLKTSVGFQMWRFLWCWNSERTLLNRLSTFTGTSFKAVEKTQLGIKRSPECQVCGDFNRCSQIIPGTKMEWGQTFKTQCIIHLPPCAAVFLK